MTPACRNLLALACALLVAAPVTVVAADAPAGPAPSPAGSASPAKARRAAGPDAAAAKQRARPGSTTESAAGPRRLEDVRIEGELEVPRVTFITVRQPHRFTDYTRATSVRSSRRMAAETALPAWIPPSPSTSQEARKESQK